MKFLIPYMDGYYPSKFIKEFKDLVIDRKYYEQTIKFTPIDINSHSENELKETFSHYDYILLYGHKESKNFRLLIYQYLDKLIWVEKNYFFIFNFTIKILFHM